jgi:hypothetical protein
MDQPQRLPLSLQAAARNSRMLCAIELSQVLEMTHAECVALMDSLTASGLLRKAVSKTGRVYYWVADSKLLGTDSPPTA